MPRVDDARPWLEQRAAQALGVPLRIVISPKTLERNVLEFAARDKSFKEDLSPDNFVDEVKAKINAMIAALTPED